MDIRRVALIFDDKDRPETTGVYCRRALERLVEVEHFRPDEIERIPHSGFDLYLNIDDGLEYRLPPELRPLAWWAIDTHLGFSRCLEKAHEADVVFAAQRNGAERLGAEGIATACWLPLACDPEVHHKFDVEKVHDVAFVGNVFPGPRDDLLDVLRRRFRNTYVGRAYFEEMARVYSASRLVFNRSLVDDVNMRVFEAAACGSLLLTNDLARNGQAEFFRDGVHIATYSDAEEMLDKAAYYLVNDAVRERIAMAGRAEAIAGHTYRHRMEQMLGRIGEVLNPVSVSPRVRLAKADILVQEPRRPQGDGLREGASGPGDGYYEFARPELLEMIPRSARSVLDVGCGAGRLGEALKARQEAEVVGMEYSPEPAARAGRRLDRVVVGDVEHAEPGFAPGSFDCVVCGDVLEHLRDPAAFLERVREWLGPEGLLVASIPNVRHHSVVTSLLGGNFTYEPAGLLDKTHLHFFTRSDIEAMLDRCGFRITGLSVVPGPGYEEWAAGGRRGDVHVGGLHLSGLEPEDAEGFFVYQYLVEAKPRVAEAAKDLTSIVIRTFNERELTRRCLESVRAHTDGPYELIVVDNGSTDGTVESLRSQRDVTLIENRTNRGIPAAANQGIQAGRGRYVVLLDNDTVVTSGWLRRLVATLERDPRAGLVGPCTNWPEGEQGVDLGYRGLSELGRRAEEWGRSRPARSEEVAELNGFCLLFRRELFEQIGPFDESFGLGLCEDKDYCRRSTEAGYRNVIARDVFVHHEGHRTFVANRLDSAGLFAANRRRFHEKWDRTPAVVGRQSFVEAGNRAKPVAPHQLVRGHQETPTRADGLRIVYLSRFDGEGRTEAYAADAMERLGHQVLRLNESEVAGADEVLEAIERFGADCLLFFKGRIGVDPGDLGALLRPDPSRILDVLRRARVPAYLWFFDRVHGYDTEPARLDWMRQVGPLCRVAFVTDGGLATTDWANWHVLRAGVSRPTVERVEVPEGGRRDLAFIGQLYGDRHRELEPVCRAFEVDQISQVYGRALSRELNRYRIILGPHYPNAPQYWSDRIYLVLGHGGFFLAPEVPGMREEGFEPGVHYAPLGDDPIRDIRDWLARPDERARIARQGQELVLGRFTYDDRARELCAVIAETLHSPGGSGRPSPSAARQAGLAGQRPVRRFRHRRKLGDVIYSLPVIRHLGGGLLYLDPTSHDGVDDREAWRWEFERLLPFLEQQPYLSGVRLYEGEAFDVDLDDYLRTSHGTPGDRVTIVANHFAGQGIDIPETVAPWLVAETEATHYPIVVHRSPRYHGKADYSFLRRVANELYCVGSPEERRPFEAIGGRPILADDIRILASVINSGAVFVGNQSLPLALAVGLGKRRMIEESGQLPNCTFGDAFEFVLTDDADVNFAGLRRLQATRGRAPGFPLRQAAVELAAAPG